jgi:general stress protein 26
MNPIVNEFLTKERVCVLSGILPDGSSHSSTLHFSHSENPTRIYFQTWDESDKVKALREGDNKSASVVVGFSETDKLTLQMRGSLRIISDSDELEKVFKIHYAKHPFAEKFKSESTVMIEFTPTWWKYSDFKTDPETVISS